MVLLDLSSAVLHMLAAHSPHWLLGQLHTADESLKALVDAVSGGCACTPEPRWFTAMPSSGLPAPTPEITSWHLHPHMI
ncbi:rCG26205 [Rattus norvegicus]|uniref:RCG26205 n=1 Tax=Rattus norvegicus TaxID=10116 RepID=A6HNH6_RAT|nr:rCG26205 [Rattus norvegicus]